MSNASSATLRKFPVIAPDGKEYRVEIVESKKSNGWCAFITLYAPRRLFGFRKLGRTWLENGEAPYQHAYPDYKALAEYAVLRYQAHAGVVQGQADRRAQAAADFKAWDGRIKTEEDAE